MSASAQCFSPSGIEELPKFNVERQLWRVPVGTEFEDFWNKQRFVKTGEIINARGERKHVVRCLHSPFTEPPGPICSAFFTHVGSILYLNGGKRVLVRAKEKEVIHAPEA